jgi:hypothetical protein
MGNIRDELLNEKREQDILFDAALEAQNIMNCVEDYKYGRIKE